MSNIEQIRKNAPMGATHYHEQEYFDSFYFYSNDVALWFVWNQRLKYWSSNIFEDRIEHLKPLS